MRNVLLAVFLLLSIYTRAIPSGYSFYKKFTTQENQITVGTSNSNGFPVLVRITDPDLRSVNNGGRVRSANGYDIVFTAGDKNTLIPFQVEEYDATTGEYVAWVKLPVLSATVNTDFYMFFGNASIATTLGSKTTWDVNYKAVYHLNSDVADWTSNAASLTNSGTTNFSPGIAADGQRVGSGTYLSRPATSGLQITGDLTLETWINFNSLISGSNENLIISSSSNGSGSNFNTNYSLSVVGSGSSTGTFVFRWQYGSNSDEIVSSSVPFTSLAGSGWRNVVVTRDNSSKLVRFYVDGIQLGASVAYVNSATGGSSNSFLIGKNLADASRTIDAAMDEIRISNSVRSPEWIQAAYMSYKPASTFLINSQTFSVSSKNFCFCNVGLPGYTSLGVFNTHTYFISTQKETWQKADSIASSLGGHLVSINSVTENLFLSTAVLDRFWIGLTDSVTEGTFVWTSGETVSYTNWSVLQPDNSGNSDYALFNTSVLSFWDDLPDSPQLFVIEFDCTAPTATLVTANAGVDQTICGNTATMAATFSPAAATGQWAVYSGAATFTNSNSATTAVSGFSSGSNLLIWKVSLGSCTAVYDTVKILTDTVLPKVVCPANVFATNSSGQCSGIGSWTLPSITDNCPGPVLTQISGLSNGSSFPVGTSSVSYRVTDNSGNTANCSFFVTVSDDEAPKIICSGDLSFPNDPGLCGSFVTGIAPLTTADNCSGFTVTYTISGATILSGNDDASGSFFNIGSSKLIYTITDATGNQSSCSFNITILDTEFPVYTTCPTNITVGTNPGLCSAVVSWPAPVASDNCPGLTITQSTGPSSGSAFPVGTTTIKYIATDASLNNTVCLFDITVEDTIAPVFITCPSNITLPSTAALCGSVVIWTDPTFDDNCTGAILTQVSGLPKGSVFPVGTSTVVYKVTDAANLSRFCSFNVTITDLIPPVFSSCPLDIFINTTPGNCGAVVNWPIPTATDNCALASLFQTSGLPNGSFFPVGTTSISYLARDAASNTSTCNFNVIVSDVEPPLISCPANISTVNDSGLCSAIITGISPLANSDNCGSTTLSYTITGSTAATGSNDASGTAFNIGNSLVTYLLKDNVGNTSTCSFNVTVNPVITFSDAGPSQLLCDTFTTMAANTPVAAIGTWSLISGSGVIVSPNSPTSLITGMTAGTSIFRWTVENSSCASSFSDVSITVDAKPSTAIAGPKQIICSNSGNLSANTPLVGQGNWTLISGLGSITNPISATSAVSALGLGNNIFRWTITNGVCPPSFDDDTIFVVTIPTLANAGADQASLCGVTSTTLAANAPTVGTGAWSIVSGVGGSFVAANNPTTTFNGVAGNSYILRWTISNAPCTASSDDVLITFNVNPTIANAGADQTSLCGVTSTTLVANTPTVGTGAWSIVSGVGGSFVTPSNPTTTFNGVIGSSYVLRWTISNAPCSASSDDVLITFNSNPTVANAGADQTSLCGVTSTSLSANTPTVGTGAWSIVSGVGGSFVASTNPTTTFNGVIGGSYVLRWTISNAPCTATSDDVLITFNSNPTAANAGADQTSLCGVTSTTLAANTPTVGTGAWSIVSGVGGSFVAATNPTTTFNGVIGSSYVLRWTISNAPCTASSDDVLISFNANPTAANAGTDQISSLTCGLTSVTLSGNTPISGSGLWSIISGGAGSFSNASLANTIFSAAPGVLYTLKWTISNGCGTSSDTVLVKLNANPSASLAGADQTVACDATSTLLAANSPIFGVGTWSIVSGLGGSVQSPNSPISAFIGTLSNAANVTYTLRWTITNAPCVSSSDDIVITFPRTANAADAGTDIVACGTNSATLNAGTPGAAHTGVWTIVSGTPIGNFSNPTSRNSTFTGSAGSVYVLRWTITRTATGCTSFDEVTVSFPPNPVTANAGSDQLTICGTNSTTLSANAAGLGTGQWSIIAGVGGSFNNSNDPAAIFTGVVGLVYNLRWTISTSLCGSSFDDVTIAFNASSTPANAGSDQVTLCGVTSTLLSANTPISGIGSWVILNGVGGIVNSVNDPQSLFTGILGNTYSLEWSIQNPPCVVSKDTVIITFNGLPTTAIAGPNQTICGNSVVLSANTPIVGNGLWSLISGTASFTNPTSPVSAVSGLGLGVNTLRWEISTPNCGSTFSDITITVTSIPVVANAGIDQTALCGISSTTLAANTPNIGLAAWSVVSGLGGTFQNINNPTTTFSGLLGNSYVLRWTISNPPCADSFDDVIVTFNDLPSIAQAGVDQTICATTTSLAATTPQVGVGSWQVLSGTSTVANPANPTSAVNGLSLGTNQFVWTVSNGTCAPSSDTVVVFVDTPPSSAQAGVDQTICATTTILAATTPIVGSGTWQVISGSSTVANPANPASPVNGLSLSTNQFVWTVSNGTCAPSSDTIVVFVDTPPSSAQAGVDQTICAATTSLAATTPLVGSGNWQVISGSSTVANPANPTSAVNGLSLGTNQFVWTVSNGTCAPSSDTVVVFVDTAPSVAQAGVDQTICATTTSLAATTPIVGSGNWQVISGSSTVTNPANPTSAVNGLTLGANQFVWTVSNGTCAASSDTVTVFVDEAPSPANAGTNQIICSSSTNLAATIPFIGNGVWTIVSGTGVFANIQDAATSVSGIINDTNIYRWTVDNGICPSVFSDVMIVVASNPPAADAGPNDTICGNSTLLNANVSAIGVGTWTLISGSGNFVNANVATTLVNNLVVGDNIFRWTIDNPPCTPTFDDVTIHVTSIPAIADAGRDTIICSEDSIVLYGNNPNSQSKKWTILSGGGGSFSAGLDTLANSVFHGIPDSTYVLRWTLSNPPCSDSFDDVVITFLRAPSTSNAGSNQNGASTCGLTTLSLAANTPNSGVGTWSVQSGSGGTIQSINSSNSLFSGVSGGTYLLTWTIANTCGSSQSDVLISFNQKPDTALAGNDSTICASTIQLGANIPSFGTGFWKLITGSGIFSDTLLPNSTISNLSAGIHTLVWKITSPVCGSSYDTLTIQVDSLPTVLFAGNNQTICDSSSIVALNATAASIGNSYWSVISGSGTFQNPTLFNSTVSQLSYGNNLLAWNVSNGVCPIVTDTLIVSVDTPPSAANAGNNRIVCTNFVVLKADSITSGTGLWTQTLGTGANIAQPNNDTTLVNQLQLGLNSFTWTVSNGVCPSNSDTVYVDVNQASSAAVAGADTLICESTDSISIHALAPVFGIGSWKVLIGPSIISDSLQATTYIKNLQKGLNKIVWTVRNGLCSDFDVVNILVDSLPTPSSAGLVPAVCETSSSVVLAANQAITGVGQWSSASGIPVFADTNLATSSVSNLLIGTNELFWTISNGACLGVSSSVTVQVDQMSDTAKAGIDIRSCEGFSQLTLSADSPLVGIGYWTKLSGPLNVLDTANAHTALTGSATAPYSSSFSWTTSNGVCPLMVDTVSVLIDAFPSSSFAGINDTICSTNIQLNASVPSVGLGQWSSSAGTIQFADTNLATSSASGLSIGSNTLYWTVSNGVCADSVSSVNIFVDQAPSTALAGADISACENTSGIALNAQASAVGSGNWTVLSGSFQLVNSSQANSALQNIGPGNTVFLWTVVNGVCPSSSDTVSVTVSAIPSNAVVGANQILCENAALVNVYAITPTSGTGSWSVIQGGGSVLSPTSATTQVTFNKGINAYAYTISNGACPSSVDTAYVTIDSISALAFAGNDLIICENATAISLNATFVNYGVAQWTSLTPGISIVNPAQNNTAISGVVLGSNKLVWTSSNGVCPANSDTVEIIVSALPSVATAGSNQNWCDTITQIQLQGNVPQIGSGVWIPISGSGTLSNPGSANTTVSGLQVGSAVFEWVISSGACTASRDTVSITINASPTPSNAGTNQNYCINSNAITLNGNVPTIGTGTWSLLSGNATIDNVSQANSNIQVADSGNYIFNWTITNGVCQSSSSTTIHIDALPSPANAGADITANTPAVFLNAEIPQIGTGAWLLYQGTGTISDINNPTTQVSGLTQGTTVLSWTVSNGACAYSADEITISYLDLVIPNAISPNNDGINDAFVVPGLEYYSDVKFTLFNSWGTIVYESSDYKNDFAGITNSGQKLIDDTYYFVLQISSDLEYKGYLIIKK